jgi:hypothetical protein
MHITHVGAFLADAESKIEQVDQFKGFEILKEIKETVTEP